MFIAVYAQHPAAAEDRPVIFAAASLSDALGQIARGLEPAPRLSFGGSGAIARQVDHGAPADVVLLANVDWMDWLEARGHVLPGTRRAPFGNRLVLVGPPGAAPLAELSTAALLDRLAPQGRLAMGQHKSVPAGQYSAAWLQRAGLWDALRPHLAETETVRAALALVSRAEVPLALVYASDLTAAPDAATMVWTIPDSQQPRIRYALAAITDAGAALAAQLTSPAALQVFARYGFEVSAPIAAAQ